MHTSIHQRSSQYFTVWKIYYFLIYGAAGSLLPYLVIFYDLRGISAGQIGVLAAVFPIMMLVSAPLWGSFVDASRKDKLALYLASFGAMASVFIMTGVETYLGLIVVVSAYAIFNAPIISMYDNSVMEMLGEQKSIYGRLRVWGSVGWGIMAPLVGWMIDRFSINAMFYWFLILMSMTLLVAWFLPLKRSPRISPPVPGSWRVFLGKSWLVFLAAVFIAGVGLALINNYLFLYLDELGASKTLMGISVTIAILSELPVLYYGDRLVQRQGLRGLMIISLVMYAVRLILVSVIQLPILILPIQLLNGLTYTTMWIAGVAYANRSAQDGLGATAQGLFSGTYLGLGGAAGALLGGYLYDTLGAAATFRLVGIGILAIVAILAIFWGFSSQKKRNRAKRTY